MAVCHLLLKSFWSNETIFQLMMLAYYLFLLIKIDRIRTTEYRLQIKTFRLKYTFLAGKIIRTARCVVMKLSEKYPYIEMYEEACLINIILHVSIRCFDLNLPENILSDTLNCECGSKKNAHVKEMMLNLNQDCENHHPLR